MSTEKPYIVNCTVCKASFRSYSHIGCCSLDCEKSLKRETDRAWRAANKDKVREYRRRWREKNREDINLRQRDYHARNPETQREANARRRSRRASVHVNTFTAKEWQIILRIYDHRCFYCGDRAEKFHQEHVIPLSRGGDNSPGNVVPACPSCNLSKGTMLPIEFKRRLGSDARRGLWYCGSYRLGS